MTVRCLIVDDNAAFLRASHALLVCQGISVVGTARTAAEGVSMATELEPDVVLVDIDLGDESGLDLARELNSAAGDNHAKVILISTHPEDDFADLISATPALGFIAKADLSCQAIIDLLGRSENAG
jgi:DNA-binding NarL/FixJ family response regulator